MSTVTTREKKLSYFREVQNELKRVTWTSKGELILCTKVVIFATLTFGLAIYGVDLGIRGAIDLAGAFVRMLVG